MALVCFLPPENIRKPVISLCFRRVLKETEGMMWVSGVRMALESYFEHS